MIDYTSTALAFPKGRPKALLKDDQRKAVEARDKAENAKARKRAKGRCEVQELWMECDATIHTTTRWRYVPVRCRRKDSQTHHLISGIGRRNRGDSILALYKLRVCAEHHREITAKILQPTTAEHTAATVRYRRVR